MHGTMPAIAKEKQVFLTIHFPKYDFTQSGGYGQRVIKYAVRIDIAGKFRFSKPCAHIGCKAGAQQQQVVRMPQARQMGGKFDRSNEVHT